MTHRSMTVMALLGLVLIMICSTHAQNQATCTIITSSGESQSIDCQLILNPDCSKELFHCAKVSAKCQGAAAPSYGYLALLECGLIRQGDNTPFTDPTSAEAVPVCTDQCQQEPQGGYWSCFTRKEGKISPTQDCCNANPCAASISEDYFKCFDSQGVYDETGRACAGIAPPREYQCDIDPEKCVGSWKCAKLDSTGAWATVDCCELYPCRELVPAQYKKCFLNGVYDPTGVACQGVDVSSTNCKLGPNCGVKYEPLCVKYSAPWVPFSSIINPTSIVPCDCQRDATSHLCGQGKRRIQCAYNSGGVWIHAPHENCAGQSVTINGGSYAVTEDSYFQCPERGCQGNGVWFCAMQLGDQTFYGPCDCDKFTHNSFTFEPFPGVDVSAGSSIQGNFTNYKPINPCDLNQDMPWALQPVCYDPFTHKLYPIGDNGSCNSDTKPTPPETCPCDDTPEVEWICTLDTPSGPLTLPCDTPCDVLFKYAERLKRPACELQLQPRCVVQGTTIPASSCPKPGPNPPVCTDEKRCKYYWQCSAAWNSWTGPCAAFSADHCRKYRYENPCGAPEFTTECVNAFTGTPVPDTFCAPIPEPDVATFFALCPEIGNCGEKQFGWACGQKYENGTVVYNAESSTFDVTPADAVDPFNHRPRVCRCGPTCDGYWLFSTCIDLATNAVVANSNCDPATQPMIVEQFCKPNLPKDKCDSDCNLQCYVEVNQQRVYFPCTEYQQYCKKLDWLTCGDAWIRTECGVVDADGVFYPSEDQSCCKGLSLPWADESFWSPGTSYPCSGVWPEPFEATEVVQLSDDDIFSELMAVPSQRGCFYGWLCLAANGKLVECNCEILRKHSYTQVIDVSGVATWESKWCESEWFEPTCYKWSANSPTPIATSDQDCIDHGFPEPSSSSTPPFSEEICKEECEDKKFQWVCTDGVNQVPCDPNYCQLLAFNGQHCDRFKVKAQCQVYSTSTSTWSTTTHADCIGTIGYPFPPNTVLSQICPGEPMFCEPQQGKYYWTCLVNGKETFVNDLKTCDCNAKTLEIAGQCPYYLQNQCMWTNGFTSVAVPNSDCVTALGGPTPPANIKCDCTEPPEKYELKCYKNGDLNLPIPCAKECKFRDSCDEYTIQATCWTTGAFPYAVPLANCAPIPGHFNTFGQYHCQPPYFSKHCNVEWQCRATNPQTNQSFTYPCSKKNYCPFSSNDCIQYKVNAVCVSVQSTGVVQIANQVCIDHGLPAPIPPTSSFLCPQTLPAHCFDSVSYEWRCYEGQTPPSFPTSVANTFDCARPTTCQDRLFANPKRCGDWYLTGACYQTTYNAATATTTYIEVNGSFCDWNQWPIIDSSGFNISAICHNVPCSTGPVIALPCKNRAINPPACNIFVVDDVISVPTPSGTIDISWNTNAPNACDLGDDALVLIHDQAKPYADIVRTTKTSHGQGAVSSSYADTTVVAQIIDACGNAAAGGDVELSKWCALAKCAAPRICFEEQRACVCPKPDQFGEKCDQTFTDFYTPICAELDMIPDVASTQQPPCKCASGLFDPRTGKCVEQCANDIQCANGGKFDQESCTCKCPPGFYGRQCECFERHFNITFVKQPANWDSDKELWSTLIAQYLAFDYKLPLDAVTVISAETSDAGFVVIFRVRTCSKDVLDAWIKFYEAFKSGYNEYFGNKFQLLADSTEGSDHTVPSATYQSDVAVAAGGASSYSDIYSPASDIDGDGEEEEDNSALALSSIVATIIAAALVVVM